MPQTEHEVEDLGSPAGLSLKRRKSDRLYLNGPVDFIEITETRAGHCVLRIVAPLTTRISRSPIEPESDHSHKEPNHDGSASEGRTPAALA